MIEIIGYLASILVASAMLFNSIVKLRWFSLIGSTLFTIYGFTIGAYPVGAVNGFIMLTNIFFLSKMYTQKEYFRTLEVKKGNKYLKDYLEFNKEDIQKFMPGFLVAEHDISLLILRNMQVAGVFLAERKEDRLLVKLDYVSKEYRDFKLGKYIYNDCKSLFKDKGLHYYVSESQSKKHNNYLKKLGFVEQKENNSSRFIKKIA
jgi:hypothetical protein